MTSGDASGYPRGYDFPSHPRQKEAAVRTADAETQRKIVNRLKRARGQLDAVIREVEGEGRCKDVVTQLSAVSTALDRAGFAIVSSAMKHCLADPSEAADGEEQLTVAELEKLFLSLA